MVMLPVNVDINLSLAKVESQTLPVRLYHVYLYRFPFNISLVLKPAMISYLSRDQFLHCVKKGKETERRFYWLYVEKDKVVQRLFTAGQCLLADQ